MEEARYGQWISIKDSVPDIGHFVLVTKFGDVNIAYRTVNKNDDNIYWVTLPGMAYEKEEETRIKAWMELPEPYKE